MYVFIIDTRHSPFVCTPRYYPPTLPRMPPPASMDSFSSEHADSHSLNSSSSGYGGNSGSGAGFDKSDEVSQSDEELINSFFSPKM